jgi:hypothetical protein
MVGPIEGDSYAEGVSLVLQSVITCPLCETRATETMPENACQYFYRCQGCGETLKPLAGDCCVFCSYGTVECPPKQQAEAKDGSHVDAHGC